MTAAADPSLDAFITRSLDQALAEGPESMAVATADAAHGAVDERIRQVLTAIRAHAGMDVVFVSKFVDGTRYFQFVDAVTASLASALLGRADPLEQSWCFQIAHGRMPEVIADASPLIASGIAPRTDLEIRTHLSAPIVLPGGHIYGTVCCFSSGTKGQDALDRDIHRLRAVAEILARRIRRAS